jgi:hypothetical protein
LASKERREHKELILFALFVFFRGYSFNLPALAIHHARIISNSLDSLTVKRRERRAPLEKFCRTFCGLPLTLPPAG